jgi:mono/diheme cytochrome c family protein
MTPKRAQTQREKARGSCLLGFIIVLFIVVVAVAAWARFTSDSPVTYEKIEDHFKYGSTGGERSSGIPYSIWMALPELFPEYLPGKGLQSLGFIYEPGKDLPIGVSKRRVQGIDRVFLNCAVCHVGSVRDTPASAPRIIVGMPSNTVDLQGFERFLSAIVIDQKFSPDRIIPVIQKMGTDDCLNQVLLKYLGVALMRDQIITLRQQFSFMDREPVFGPGRFDTFNPPKVLMNFRMDNLPEAEWVGVCDFPSIWHQQQREGMELHWDGNNTSVDERNRSAAFGTGALPPTLDRASIKRTEDWLLTAAPPAYPYPVDAGLVAKGKPIYAEYCASCHGASGTDFTGQWVGKVTPIDEIKTDRHRLDSYSFDLCVNQGQLYAAYPSERFTHFRKTNGYANAPLDGIWLRAPYLHNGSVPTLRALLEPAANRPATFYRGYDVYDPKDVGFITTVATEGDRKYFLYDTSLPGNGNQGHEGRAFGTELSPDDKQALIEFLKTF